MLNIITAQYGSTLTEKGRYVRVRNDYWFELEDEEIPEHVLNAWRGRATAVRRISPDEYPVVDCSLTPRQMASFNLQFRGLFLSQSFRLERFLQTLGENVRRQALEAPVTSNELNPQVRMMMTSLLDEQAGQPQARPSATRNSPVIRIVPEDTRLCLDLSDGNRRARFIFDLPFKAPALTDALITRPQLTNAKRSLLR